MCAKHLPLTNLWHVSADPKGSTPLHWHRDHALTCKDAYCQTRNRQSSTRGQTVSQWYCPDWVYMPINWLALLFLYNHLQNQTITTHIHSFHPSLSKSNYHTFTLSSTQPITQLTKQPPNQPPPSHTHPKHLPKCQMIAHHGTVLISSKRFSYYYVNSGW